MKFLQGNDVLELIRNRASVQRRRFALKMLIIYSLYLISMLGTAAVSAVCAVILLFSQKTMLSFVFFGISAICAVLTFGMARRRPQFIAMLGKLICNILFTVAAVVLLLICTAHMLLWIFGLAFCAAMWVLTVWGYAYSRR